MPPAKRIRTRGQFRASSSLSRPSSSVAGETTTPVPASSVSQTVLLALPSPSLNISVASYTQAATPIAPTAPLQPHPSTLRTSSSPLALQRATNRGPARRLRHVDYTIGWICALPVELAAAKEMLDEEHQPLPQHASDPNSYTLGRVGKHNTVLMVLGLTGTNSAASAAAQMKSTFTSVQLGVMVGIGGGVPSAKADIRLGDVVVCQPSKDCGGVIQYDSGKTRPDGVERTGFLNAPSMALLNAVARLKASHLTGRFGFVEHLAKLSNQSLFARDKAGPDVLYDPEYNHEEGEENCNNCKQEHSVRRQTRGEHVMIHYGTIASGNQVMRDAKERDKVSAKLGGVLCFEMEAAGVMNSFQCLPVRGICDYSDSHKSKSWQPYAAGTAAAYAKELLLLLPPAKVEMAKVEMDPFTLRVIPTLPMATGAAFDSHQDEHSVECLQDTRTELLRDISDWAEDPHGKFIFWLNGVAGTGKSTISRTVARSFEGKGQLGASFFFKRGEDDRGNVAKFFTTIASQLAIRRPQLSPFIARTIDNDPTIVDKSSHEQFQKLIIQPLKDAPLNFSPLIVVVDALDECEQEQDVRSLIQILEQGKDVSSVQLRIFITSRPELPIRLGFIEMSKETHLDVVLHVIQQDTIRRDLALYLHHEFARIRRKHNFLSRARLPSDWPGDETIQKLVEMAIPLFIFAATVCRFIADLKWNPKKTLAAILEHQHEGSNLERTYLPILDQQIADQPGNKAKAKLVAEFREIVGIIITLATPLSIISIAQLLGVSEDDIEIRLDSLHSVLSIPEDKKKPVRLLHLSFRDFLVDTEKAAGEFWVDEHEMHGKVAIKCLQLMSKGLKNDICSIGIQDPGKLRAEISDKTIKMYLPAEVQYACQYWVHHLENSKEPLLYQDAVQVFLKEHFLHWLEAMGLIERMTESVNAVNTLQSLFSSGKNTELQSFLFDAKRFLLKNRWIIEHAPLQTYISALIFAPEMSIIRKQFQMQIPDWILFQPNMQDTWDAALQTLEGHSGAVRVVAFSPDGKQLALWDAGSGKALQELKGHSGPFRAVAFSPDGNQLASASNLPRSIIFQEQWVAIGTEKLLWLPAEYRSSKFGAAVHEGKVGWGCPSGRVLIMEFIC
ncbi:hypothetical protein EJ06DRAFT_511907 [Trichodelitschia bisporula]|uniref:Uncharacterized protein n=1 Tax=Trichodelitschia bisporula TaxID=703511 RepID=A0A6G1HUK1_9PEZI|nr:hypothetical protein EJ06DRAFT_511907 [Trichodelitschia bisporula]